MLFLIIFTELVYLNTCKKFKDEEKPAWAKKDIRDYNEADLERLLEQWEVSIYLTSLKSKLHFSHVYCYTFTVHQT